MVADFYYSCGHFGVFLTFWLQTVCKVLILSALSGTKETAGVAGAGTQSALVHSSDVGGTWLHLNLEMEPKYLMKSDVQWNLNILKIKNNKRVL